LAGRKQPTMAICSSKHDEIIKSLQNTSIVLQCQVVDDGDLDIESNKAFNVYYPDGKFNINNAGHQSIEKTLQEIIYDATINHSDVVIRQNLVK
jgi:hypothetical protein